MGISYNSQSDENFISKKENLKNLPFQKKDVFFKLAVMTIFFRWPLSLCIYISETSG